MNPKAREPIQDQDAGRSSGENLVRSAGNLARQGLTVLEGK